MKRVISVVLALAISVSMLSACGNQSEKDGSEIIQGSDVKEKSEKESSGLHTLYFKDSTKSERAVATFFNNDSGESTDVEMKKISEDSESVTFSCEGDCTAYDMAYVTCGDKKSREFAFNKCVRDGANLYLGCPTMLSSFFYVEVKVQLKSKHQITLNHKLHKRQCRIFLLCGIAFNIALCHDF